ncbi:MAG: T9SS type A sorting domain-containing protein [Ginsengibacter sp.]
MKRIFYIFLFIVGFSFSSNAQVKPAYPAQDVVKTIKFYPNPAESFINFEFSKNYNNTNTLYIFNFIGKKIIELKISDKKITVPLTDVYRGVYVFQLRDDKGNIVESGKFQVAK